MEVINNKIHIIHSLSEPQKLGIDDVSWCTQIILVLFFQGDLEHAQIWLKNSKI